MLRNVIAVIIGLFAGMALNMGILEINYLAYPIPEGLDINNPAQLQDYLDTLPALAFLVVMVAHLAQSFGGGWVAARLGSSRPMLLAMIVGTVSLAGGAGMMTMVKGPGWMAIELPLDIARILTLAVRLLANMFADHTVIAVWIGLVPIGVPAIFMGLGLIVSFLQAFIFALLTMIYIGLALEDPH